MRIGIMLRHIQEKGGIVTYTQNMLKGFLKDDNQHHFALVYASRDMLGTYADDPRVSEHVISGNNRFVWDHFSVPRLANRLDLDVIYNPKLSVPLWARQKRILTLRPEQFVHPELFPFVDRQYFKLFMPLYCRAAARILAPAESSRLDIINFVGADPKKVVTVHEGAGDHFFEPAPEKRVLDEVRRKYQLPEKYILFVGGLTPLKNFERLVEAFSRVHPKHDIPLVVVGFKRWKFEQDLAFAEKNPAAAHIHFPGFVDDLDMPHVYRMAQTLFFPSIYEGFGIPVCEGFATGCPVIASSQGASPEVAGGAALLVDPFDVDDMTRGLDRMLSDKDTRDEHRQKGYERSGYFRFSRAARQTLEVFESALAD